ncbi:MAG TPA: DUF1697 domain-containing protein [Mycobacteriales bacterium]|jgi:uncharacterized protein (DUF1697 family)|nr:DUF1697 domain-containing protein [Mycobacteriales bacterium]
MPTWVALLRAVNLGAHNKVSMPKLRTVLTDAGFTGVKTYVNSGNVVLDSTMRSPAKVGQAVHDLIGEHFEVDTPVMMRTGRQLAAVLDWNPFPDAAADHPKLVAVLHLSGAPEAELVETFLAGDYAPIRVAHRGEEVVIDWHDATGRPNVDRALKKLGVHATARNWRTLTALTELTRE